MINFSRLPFFLVLYFSPIVGGLTPSRLPNGKLRTFISSIPPSKDLYKINYSQASLITKNWLQNIVVASVEKERNKLEKRVKNKSKDKRISSGLFEMEDAHIVTSINQLEGYIQQHRSPQDIYMCWKPKSNEGIESVLFIVVAEVDKENKKFSIKQLVPSPFWSPEQIESNELKKALIHMNDVNNCTEIDMNHLYQNDLRYRLAWATWKLDLDNKNHTFDSLKVDENNTSIIDIELQDIDKDDLSPSDTEHN
tara:strand:- start:4753 stop:5508 length:756 start_codon:yes stop_codon:yes gene_type:complete